MKVLKLKNFYRFFFLYLCIPKQDKNEAVDEPVQISPKIETVG